MRGTSKGEVVQLHTRSVGGAIAAAACGSKCNMSAAIDG